MRYQVVPWGDAGWRIEIPGAVAGSLPYGTRAEAEAEAKRLAAEHGGGEVIVEEPDGTLRVTGVAGRAA